MTAAELQRKWSNAVNDRDMGAFGELYAPNAVMRDPAYDGAVEGRDSIRSEMEQFLRAFPDLRVAPRTWVEENGVIATEGEFEGTHEGPLVTPAEEIPGSGRRVRFTGAAFYQLDGQGRVLEERRYYDIAGILAQLGVLSGT